MLRNSNQTLRELHGAVKRVWLRNKRSAEQLSTCVVHACRHQSQESCSPAFVRQGCAKLYQSREERSSLLSLLEEDALPRVEYWRSKQRRNGEISDCINSSPKTVRTQKRRGPGMLAIIQWASWNKRVVPIRTNSFVALIPSKTLIEASFSAVLLIPNRQKR